MPLTKAPSTKSQAPGKHQAPNLKLGGRNSFGVWCLGFLWSLELGIWSFFCSIVVLTASAQPNSIPPQQDPLMSLMLSQPKVDITTNVTAVAAFDPPVVGPGEQSIYRVTFNALEETIDWPKKLNAPTELQTEPGAHGQIIPMLGPVQVPYTTFNMRVRASTTGDFTIPEFKVQAYGHEVTVPSAQLKVVSTPPSASPILHLAIEFAETNLFVCQPTRVRAILPGSAGVFSQ